MAGRDDETGTPTGEDARRHGMTRRRALLTGGGLLGVAAAGGAGYKTGQAEADGGSAVADAVPFFGEHQAGIATPAQDRLVFGAFDLTIETAAELQELLRE